MGPSQLIKSKQDPYCSTSMHATLMYTSFLAQIDVNVVIDLTCYKHSLCLFDVIFVLRLLIKVIGLIDIDNAQ